jgi:hypothetical protein
MGQEDSQLGVKQWSVIISIDEHDNSTEANAHLYRPGEGLNGVGRAPFKADERTPASIVDELAAARALSDLARQLFKATAADIHAIKPPAAADQ